MESTIADEFLNDLEGLSDSEEDLPKRMKLAESESIEKSELLDSPELASVLKELKNENRPDNESLLERCNAFFILIETDISLLHKCLRDLFYARFPELEDLIPTAFEYSKAVMVLINDTYNQKDLEKCVGSNVLIAIATALISSPLKPVTNHNKITSICDEIFTLSLNKAQILQYIQVQMKKIAPNLVALLGGPVAANILSAAGSIEKLSLVPSCNIQVLGLNRSNQPGMSTTHKFKSYLSYSPFVLNSGALKKKALRMLAGKVALAARIDRFHQFPAGEKGEEFLQQLQESLRKSVEIDNFKMKKPLPVPAEIKNPKRGGKRIRAVKKKYQKTEIMKQMNRVEFGIEEQEEYRDTGFTFGMLGKGNKTVIKASRKKRKISEKLQTTPGFTSCFAFTHENEVKLENPQFSVDTKSKYFDSNQGFATVLSSSRK